MGRHLLALLVCGACTFASGVQPVAEPLLGEASAVLRINDLGWIERELTSYAATSGSDPAPLRGSLAQALFHSRSLAGIDTARPAVIAWRSGRSPLLAVIPLSDRRAFLDDFGAVSAGGAPLVKVGERNGTVVYTQNTDAGLDEYRLLVQDDCAYLARTVDECRLLATRPPRIMPAAAALTFRANGEFVRQPRALAPETLRAMLGPLPSEPLADGMAAWVARGWNDFIDQIAFVSAEIGPGGDGLVRLQGKVEAKADTVLAQWTAAQRNAASRLLPLVRGPDTVLVISGQFDWQGQLDRLGQRLTAAARAAIGDAWTPQIEEAWRGQWEIADRAGPFALAVDAVLRAGKRGFVTRELREQPRAQELVGLQRLLAQARTGASGATVEAITAGGLSGFRIVRAGQPDEVTVADDRRQLSVQSDGGDAVAAITALVATLARPLPPPTGAPAVVAVLLDLTGVVRAAEQGAEGVPLVLPQVDCALAIKATPQGNLVAELDIPLQRVAVLMREAAAGKTVK